MLPAQQFALAVIRHAAAATLFDAAIPEVSFAGLADQAGEAWAGCFTVLPVAFMLCLPSPALQVEAVCGCKLGLSAWVVARFCMVPCFSLPCRFGTEHEKLGYFVDSHRRIDHEAISKLLHQICTRFSWQPIMEKGNIIGATLENASVTLEPGGQFELSGAPLDSLHKTCSEVNSHLYEAGAPCTPVTVGCRGSGIHFWSMN